MKKLISIIVLIILSQVSDGQSDSSYFTIRLSSFDVSVSNNYTKLHWKTTCYLQYANFQLQRSLNGVDFITINSFIAEKLRCQQPFDFTDSSVNNQGNNFYRINVGSINGKFYHSLVRRVFLKEKGFDLVSVYPTLITNSIYFSLSNSENETFHAIIINQTGSIVKSKYLEAPKGLSNYNFPTSDLPSGYYWLLVLNNQNESRKTAFVK